MAYVKWTLGIIVVVAVGLFLHYNLPSRDIVRIVGTEVARADADARDAQGNIVSTSRDVRYIKTATPDGEPRVFRNEDTGWGWPPYFKFDEADLAAEADNNISPAENPRWMVVTHYGWRLTYFSWFPNAVDIRPATGPDERLIPWFNIAVVGLLIAAVLAIRWRIMRLFGG